MKIQFSKHVVLKGSEKSAPDAKKLAKSDKKELLNITIKIRPKQALPDLLDPEVFKGFTPITQQELADKYGLSDNDIKIVHSFAHH